MRPTDLRYYRRAKKAGVNYAWRIIEEARREGVQLSLAIALIEQETGFKNVYGHDAVKNPVKSPPGGLLWVTEENYRRYLTFRRRGLGMQGVGPAQLTYYTLQDAADKEGGCWKPRFNLRIGFRMLAANIRQKGEWGGVKAYNGSGQAATDYANRVLQRRDHWHTVLVG